VSCPGTDEILDYLGARLSADRRDVIARHAADCAGCRVALSELARDPLATTVAGAAPALRAPARPGETIGRHVIVERIGRGGMGVVYLAHDPQLERRVAVKLLHERIVAGGSERLLREAQALARISDERVVTIFDAGVHQGRPFVVMEHIRGVTLGRWLQKERRPWRLVLDRFLDAGRGLAAVHAAGIAHGDFKPDNVLVGDDGRVRVTDFGLARWVATAAAPAPANLPSLPGTPAPPTTESGSSLGGTPAYMAPEQLRGERGDALSDQFSFCVALYEGLVGARPFAGQSLEELAAAMTRPPASPSRPLPRWLLRVVLRGLAFDRAARFPSLAALLAELENRLRRPRRLALATSALVLIGVVGVLVRNQLPQADRSCRIDARRLGAAWDPRLVEPAVRAAPAFAAVDGALRRSFADWVTVRVGACEEASASDAAARAHFAARMACLDERRQKLVSIVHGLSHAVDMQPIANELAALPPPQACITK
jgi:predicted Ser/Thr protein kinase